MNKWKIIEEQYVGKNKGGYKKTKSISWKL